MTDNDLPEISALPCEPPFFEALGEMIVYWNRLDNAMRGFLLGLYDAQSFQEIIRANAIIVELGNVGLAQAVKTLANEILSGEVRDHTLHAVKYFERLREYRNYYAHSIASIIPAKSGPHGFAAQTTAKGKYKWSRDPISIPQVRDIARHCYLLVNILTRISWHRTWQEGDPHVPERPPLHPMPPLPDTLEKRVESFRLLAPPHEASRE